MIIARNGMERLTKAVILSIGSVAPYTGKGRDMGKLATYLQGEFKRLCPIGWTCETEQRLLAATFDDQMGYSSRVDVLLQRADKQRRLWIEFEVSRADPVANHAKFSVAHLFQPQLASDTFVSMISPRVEYGRANLAANMITLMRSIGMDAFQIPLTPYLTATQINQLNTLAVDDLAAHPEIESQREIDRILAVVEPAFTSDSRRIHFASNLLEVILNVRTWNAEISQAEYYQLWGKRTISYFVFDPVSGLFAPSKFCAYVLIGTRSDSTSAGMSIPLYTSLDETEKSFDGHRAHTHLTRHLTMQMISGDEAGDIMPRFERWLAANKDNISVHSRGPTFILPPTWFRKGGKQK